MYHITGGKSIFSTGHERFKKIFSLQKTYGHIISALKIHVLIYFFLIFEIN